MPYAKKCLRYYLPRLSPPSFPEGPGYCRRKFEIFLGPSERSAPQLSSTFIWLRSLLHFYIVLSPLSSGAKNALLRSDCFNETLPPIFWGMVGVNAHTYMHTVMGTTEDHSVPLLGFFFKGHAQLRFGNEGPGSFQPSQ